MLKIASFNVNSLRARLPNVLAWLKDASPDVALLQELKCTETDMPRLELEALGYNIIAIGQKTYNGVAVLSKTKIQAELTALPDHDAPNQDIGDEQARYVEAIIDLPNGKNWKALRVASIYLPNGNPVTSEKYPYKLAWMKRLRIRAAELLRLEEPTILGGDFNCAPADEDVYDPAGWAEDALCRPETRAEFRSLLNLGYLDSFRHFHPEGHRYTFWDYQAGRWPRDEGLRIDHLLLSPQAADCLSTCEIDRNPRKQDKPSDHTPIWCGLEI